MKNISLKLIKGVSHKQRACKSHFKEVDKSDFKIKNFKFYEKRVYEKKFEKKKK